MGYVVVIREEVDEPAELSTRVATIVPALATLTFALVRLEVLDDGIDPHHATRLRDVRRTDCCSWAEEPGFWVVASGVLWQRAGVPVKLLVLNQLSTSNMPNRQFR